MKSFGKPSSYFAIFPSRVYKMTDTDDITGCRSKPDSFGSIIFLSWWRFGS